MRLEIHADCHVAAAGLLIRGDAVLDEAAGRLASALAGCGGMAGHAGTAVTWAAGYDAVAASAVRGLSALAAGLASAASTTGRCLAGHAVAEEVATLGPAAFIVPAPQPPPAVLPAPVPSAHGVNGAGPPGWSWFESHLAGRVWPDADTSRIREAGAAWRSASAAVAEAAAYPREAARELGLLVAPEVEPATGVCRRLAGRADELARLGAAIAARCEAFADAVDTRRRELLDTLTEFLAAVAAAEAASAALALVTAGLSELAGQATVAELVASYAGRLLGILTDLDEEVAATVPVDESVAGDGPIGAEEAGEDRVAPQPSRQSREPQSVGRPDCTSESMAFATGAAATEDAAPLYADGDLDAWEAAGGHTLSRHTGWSDLELRSRLSRRPRLSHASSFASAEHAERAVGGAVRASETGIRGWLASGEGKLEMDCEAPYAVGRVVRRDGTATASSRYRVVLVKDAAERQGYRVLTAFPSQG